MYFQKNAIQRESGYNNSQLLTWFPQVCKHFIQRAHRCAHREYCWPKTHRICRKTARSFLFAMWNLHTNHTLIALAIRHLFQIDDMQTQAIIPIRTVRSHLYSMPNTEIVRYISLYIVAYSIRRKVKGTLPSKLAKFITHLRHSLIKSRCIFTWLNM